MEDSTNQAPEKSIDEQLADAKREFDARMHAEQKATGIRITPKTRKKPVKPNRSRFQVGEVAHPHFAETDDEVIEKDCLYVNHTVHDRKGLYINDKLYHGKVVVPQCVANTLSEMENKLRMMERGVFENRGRTLDYGEIRG